MKLELNYANLCEIPFRNAIKFPARVSHRYRNGESGFSEKTWQQFADDIKYLAAGFSFFGVKNSAKASFFIDNRYEWSLTDYALLMTGAVSVPRGSDTPPKELHTIFIHSDSSFLIMENKTILKELLVDFTPAELALIERVFIVDKTGTQIPDYLPPEKITYYSDVLEKGRTILKDNSSAADEMIKSIRPSSIASIIYTSGTSGNPKGVMLTQVNFLHNVRALSPLLEAKIDDAETTLSVLPSWHVYERTYEYCTAACGVTTFYSSVKNLQEDLASQRPQMIASVPRVWETFHRKILSKLDKASPVKKAVFYFFLNLSEKKLLTENAISGNRIYFKKKGALRLLFSTFFRRLKLILLHPLYMAAFKVFTPVRQALGGNLRVSFSGGGSLPMPVDLFFNSVGIKLVNAYGMTETAPGTITRRVYKNTLGSIGIPLDETEVKILKEDGSIALPGEKGILYVRGPQVMMGYYKNPAATAEILSADGWLNTGDIGFVSESGDYTITGRAKSTIVLSGGENLEPEPIEEKLKESDFVEHAVVLGQDKKALTAFISINEDRLKQFAEKWKISFEDLMHKSGEIIMHSRLSEEVRKDFKKLISRESGFKPWEAITNIVLLKKKFSIGDELTQTLKVKRKHVEKKYHHLIK